MSAAVDAMAPSLLADGPPAEPVVTGKRKRGPDPEDEPRDRVKAAPSNAFASKPLGLDELLVDILDLLKARDPSSSILTLPLPPQSENPPSPKRTKVTNAATSPVSIHDKVTAAAYQSFDEFSRDVASAISVVEDGDGRACSADFISLYEELVARAKAHDAPEVPNGHQDTTGPAQDGHGIKVESGEQSVGPLASALSFAGPGGRAYFSSLRTAGSGSNNDAQGDPLEAVLPKGMWTSTVIPVRGDQDRPRSAESSTLGDLYQKPKKLAGLRPPRDPYAATTRGQTVGWYKPKQFPSSRNLLAGGAETYSNQRLPTGTWLAGSKMPSAPASLSKERPKLGERRKSVEEPQVEEPEHDREHVRLAKQFDRDRSTATFKGAYAHFGPSYDNTRSLVPQQHRSRLWWNWKVASAKHRWQEDAGTQSLDASDSALLEDSEPPVLDEKLIEEAIESFEEDNIQDVGHTFTNGTTSTSQADRDTEEVLEEVSEMLETLSSYQRNRHSELRSKHAWADDLGTPSKPSSAEFDLHRLLRDQLAALISSLPPFAIARLDGDRLRELNINPRIEMEGSVYRGILDEETRPSNHHAGAGAGQRHPSLSAARPSSYAGLPVASPAARNSFSAPRPTSTYYPGQASSRLGSYGVYQHTPTQGPPRHSQPSYSQSSLPGQGIIQPGTRPAPTVNGYSTHHSNAASMPPRTPQYPGATMQAMQQRPGQSNPYAAGYNMQSGQVTSPPRGPQATPTAHDATSQMSPSRQSYAQYPQSAGSPPRPSAALSNGVGTIGAQIQMSPEERAMIASRQQQQQQQQWQQSPYQNQQYQQLRYQAYQQQQQQQAAKHHSPPAPSPVPKAASPNAAAASGYQPATAVRPTSSGATEA